MNSKRHIKHRRLLLLLPSSLFFFGIVPVSTFFIGKWLDTIIGIPPFPPYSFNYVTGLIVMIVGITVVIQSIRVLWKVGHGIPLGDLYPSSQSTTLLTSGIYAYTRNLMLLGYLLSLCGLGLIAQSLSIAFLLPTAYTALWIAWIKKVEEPALERRFGEVYRQYKHHTPTLIPKLRCKDKFLSTPFQRTENTEKLYL